jgi:LacI family transcriptional regulator
LQLFQYLCYFIFCFNQAMIKMKDKGEVTIYDIAKALNISASTVSRGLNDHRGINEDTKKKILKVALKMGYQHNIFARNLRKRETNTIGVVLPRLNSYFMSTVVAGMEKEANQAGYNLIISQSEESTKKEITNISTMFNSRVDGLLVSLACDTVKSDHFNVFFKKDIPVIFFDRIFKIQDYISIVINNFKAGYDATAHLIEQGCKRIVHLGGNLKCNVYADRFNGYKQALADNGIAFDKELVVINMLNEQAGIDTADRMLNMEVLPDGVFASNDVSAVAIICRLKQAGIRVPDDIAVVGFNNNPVSTVVEPNLSTIDYPGQEMGKIAASTLIKKINNQQTPDSNAIVLPYKLIIRQSSLRK